MELAAFLSSESVSFVHAAGASAPDEIAFRVAKDERIGALHDFTGENEFGIALLCT